MEIDSFNILNPESKPLIYKKKSNIKYGGDGIFAKQYIEKNTPVIIYFGELIEKNTIADMYIENKENYIKNIAPYIRDTEFKDFVIDGSICKNIENLNLNLCGYLVNDYEKIEKINQYSINKYNNSKKYCNLEIKETKDFPIYYSTKDIKKNQELFAHYGIGYWLLQNNCNISNLKKYIEKSI